MISKSLRRWMPWALLILISLSFFHAINQKIEAALPYPTHIDERHRLKTALHIIQTGDLNPHYFHKPSLPIYLTAVGLSGGFLYSAKQGKIRGVKDIGSVEYPYFDHPEIVKTAKQLFAIFAAAGIFFTGFAAYKAYRYRCLLWLPAFLIHFSHDYIYLSHGYINVNILGAFFVAILMSYIFYNLRGAGCVKKAIIPGILCGLTISSKYNFLGIYLPCFLAIIFYERAHIVSRSVLLVFVSIMTILLVNPYFLLDLPKFLDDAAYQVSHYMYKGHRGYENTPGISQFRYYMNATVSQYGLMAFVYSIFGLFYMLKIDWKKACIIISFPLSMLFLMSISKANFLRNLVPVFMLWSIFISMGVIAVYRIFDFRLKNKLLSLKAKKMLAASATLFILCSTLPYGVMANLLDVKPDSRNLVTQWLLEHKNDIDTLVVPSDLDMDIQKLNEQINIIPIHRKHLNLSYISENLFHRNTYFMLPSYGVDNRKRGRNRLLPARRKFKNLIDSKNIRLIKTFGSKNVLLNYPTRVPRGDPKFYLAKFVE